VLNPAYARPFFHEPAPVHGYAYVVEPLVGNRFNIRFGYIFLSEFLPEFPGIFFACKLGDYRFNPARPVRPVAAESPHIALREQPVPKPYAPEQDFFSVAVHEIPPLHSQKAFDLGSCTFQIVHTIFPPFIFILYLFVFV
jgi:hypothetical protein